MADVYAVEYTNAFVSVPRKQSNALWKRKSDQWQDVYEASSTASGTVIYFFEVPKNAAIIGGFLLTDALGASVTLSVGTPASATKYLAATACNTANLKTPLTIGVDDCGVEVGATTKIVVTVGGAAATGTIKLFLETMSV